MIVSDSFCSMSRTNRTPACIIKALIILLILLVFNMIHDVVSLP